MPARPDRARALRTAAPLFAALGDPRRLGIISRLCAEGPLSIAELAAGAGITRQAVSKHLRALEAAGLARGARRGRHHVWGLQPERLIQARRHLEQISRGWDQAIGRLREFVEGERH